ncbi:RNA polymerase sigma factor [Geothrix oryzisoli]|uniref:RNA polymerase sigma factor n=1 Tax=Geothrix oryzisoli TaxID=2922721 RepID=UPI001FAC0727|nr:sigma-70 family RNA polymerase sigma factor [Geothrix oryzisoli]
MTAPVPPSPASPPGEEDAILVQRVREGREEALQQLHRRYAPLVFHLACRSLDRAAAEEVVQDTFLAVWRKAADFDPAKGSFRTWLLGISRHRMLDELRARARRPQAAGDPLEQAALSAEDPLPDEALWREVQRDAVSEALAALPEPQRAALRLAFFADLTHEEVARALQVPLGTAKTRIRSGLRSLERHLGGLVAILAAAVGVTGTWIYQRHAVQDRSEQRALHLLADSQTKALRLTPPGAAPGEMGLHASFRSAPGAGIAVLTLSNFPALPAGEHPVLWIRTAQGWRHLDLQGPGPDGKALQILEAPWLAEAWPLELQITRETRPADRPAGILVVAWAGAAEGGQPLAP